MTDDDWDIENHIENNLYHARRRPRKNDLRPSVGAGILVGLFLLNFVVLGIWGDEIYLWIARMQK